MGRLHIGSASHIDALKGAKALPVATVSLSVQPSTPVTTIEASPVIERVVERIVQVPVDVIREVRVEVPVEVIKIQEKIVEVIKEVRVEVPVEIQVLKEVIKEIQVEVEKVVRVPVIQWKWRTPRWAWFAIGVIALELVTILKLLLNK